MSWLFGSLKNNSETQTSQNNQNTNLKISLPINFAEDLLNFELEIEQPGVTLDTITKLLELYGQGVEYYSTIQSDKYLIFKNKCQSLLLKPNVAAVLNNEETKTNIQKAKEMQNSLSSFANKESIAKFLKTEREIQFKMNTLIDNDIKIQEDRILQRKMKRQLSKIKLKNEDLLGITQEKDQNEQFQQSEDQNKSEVESNNPSEDVDFQNSFKLQEQINTDLSQQIDQGPITSQNECINNICHSEDLLGLKDQNEELQQGECNQFGDLEIKTSDLLDLEPSEMRQIDLIEYSPKKNESNYQEKFKQTIITQAKSFQQLFSGLGINNQKQTCQSNNSPEIRRKEKKIREMVNKNKTLAQKKSEILQNNQMLPF